MRDISTIIASRLFPGARNGGPSSAGILLVAFALSLVIVGVGCSAKQHREAADEAAEKIIQAKQKEAFGKEEAFTIDRPSDVLRRKLMIEQDLPHAGKASFGADALDPVPHWPEKEYPTGGESALTKEFTLKKGEPLKLSLVQALQVGAENSSEYQQMKEKVFQAALDLDLQYNNFGLTIDGEATSQIGKSSQNNNNMMGGTGVGVTTDQTGTGETQTSFTNGASVSLGKTLKNGATIATSIGIDIVNLLTGDRTFSKSLTGDASISIPLLRGFGKHIAAESLTQAERNVIYTLYDLEVYKKKFAVEVVTSYLNVLQQGDQVDNAAENYKNLRTSSLRTQRLSEAGRTTVIEMNQSAQEELTARSRWVSAIQQQKNQLDSFKKLIGLPADAEVELDREELTSLSTGDLKKMMNATETADADSSSSEELTLPGNENAGPLEIEEDKAISLAFENRADLKQLEDKVVDAQRAVVIKADALRAELTLLGSAGLGQSGNMQTGNTGTNTGNTGGSITGGTGNQSNNSTTTEDSGFNISDATYSGLLTLSLPIERTEERIAYRNAYISLEQAVRSVQTLEDEIKISVRQNLRSMSEARESLRIQSKAVAIAEQQSASTNMFFEAGRSELRDLLDAQSALLTARNSLTSAIVNYRVAELAFQRDAGILKIDAKGLLVEYTSEENNNANVE